jgi:hypothetical protein
MPRPLSNIEWATFMTEVQPDSLGLPQWGGILNWDKTGQYVLMFKMPDGSGWALTDVSDGIPAGSQVIPIQVYLQNVPTAPWSNSILYWTPLGLTMSALAYLASGGLTQDLSQVTDGLTNLVVQTANGATQMMGSMLKNLLSGAASGLGPAIWPLAIVAAAIVFLYVKPSKS